MSITKTGLFVNINGVKTDLINIFEPLTGTKLTYNTKFVASNGKDLTDIFEPYPAGDATANPTKCIVWSVQKDLNLIFRKLAPPFPSPAAGSGAQLTTQFVQTASMYNNNAIAGLYGGVGTYYSTDYGKSFIQSTGISGIGTAVILGVSLYGLRAIAHTQTLVWWSDNAGQSWTSTSVPGGTTNFSGCAIYESYAILAATNSKIYVSSNYGVDWVSLSMTFPTTTFRSPSISYDPVGAKYIAVCSSTNNGMWYCPDVGGFVGVAENTFVKSNQVNNPLVNLNSIGVSLVGLKGIATSSGIGFYYTIDGGINWARSNSSTNASCFNCTLSTNGVGITNGSFAGNLNYYFVTKDYGVTWTADKPYSIDSNTIHNGNAIVFSRPPATPSAASRAYYGKISIV